MMHVAWCPDVSLPHRGLNLSLRVSASTVEVKRARYVRLHQLALWRLLPSVVFGRTLALACLGRHGDWEGMKDRG